MEGKRIYAQDYNFKSLKSIEFCWILESTDILGSERVTITGEERDKKGGENFAGVREMGQDSLCTGAVPNMLPHLRNCFME